MNKPNRARWNTYKVEGTLHYQVKKDHRLWLHRIEDVSKRPRTWGRIQGNISTLCNEDGESCYQESLTMPEMDSWGRKHYQTFCTETEKILGDFWTAEEAQSYIKPGVGVRVLGFPGGCEYWRKEA